MKFFAVASILALASAPLYAQNLGFLGGYGVGVLENNTTTRAWSAFCNCDQRGGSLDQQAFVATTLLLANPNSRVTAQASLGIGTGVEQFVSLPYPASRADMPGATLEFRETLRTIVLRAEVTGRLSLGGDAWITIGPWMESLLQATLDRTEHVVSPSGVVFPDASSDRSISERDPGDPPTIRWGLTTGFALDFEVSPGIFVVPHMQLQTDMDALAGSNPGALLLSAGSAVLFDISGGDANSRGGDTPLVLPDIEPARDDSPRVLNASIDLYALRDGARVQHADVLRETTLRRVVWQMPATIELSDDSRSLADRYVNRESPASITDVVDSLAMHDPLSIDRFVLELIAMRMRGDATAVLELAGTRGRSETRDIAIARASIVRDHLVRMLGVDRKRIVVTATIAERVGAPLVLVSSRNGSILERLEFEWFDDRFQLPSIGVDPTIEASAGVRASRLRIARRGVRLVDTLLMHDGVIPEISIDLSDALLGNAIAPIIAELQVTDSSGVTTSVSDSLSLVLVANVHATDAHASYEREHMTLVVDNCDASVPCDEARSMEAVIAAVRPGARVTIGLTGDHELSTQAPDGSRVSRLRGILAERGAVVSVAAPGPGRSSVSRRIVIEIDQPSVRAER